ncbi:hypothetical protein LT493_25060 [Streptomyces tricolor]|nr:hypothetical protein [Streptomyces tricolor]
MVAVLFGLSMDYQVFLVGRMYEEWLETEATTGARRPGGARRDQPGDQLPPRSS